MILVQLDLRGPLVWLGPLVAMERMEFQDPRDLGATEDHKEYEVSLDLQGPKA